MRKHGCKGRVLMSVAELQKGEYRHDGTGDAKIRMEDAN